MQAILNIAIRGVRKAGAYLVRERERLETHPDNNKIITLQTQAEAIIAEAVTKAYPDHALNSTNTTAEVDSVATWFVEVVCGYENLLRDLPHYAIVITIEENGKTKHCLVADPMTDEIYTATAGQGAQLNTYKMRMPKKANLQDAIFTTSMLQAGQMKSPELLSNLNAEGVTLYNQGCSALGLAYVAAGRLDGFFGTALSKTVAEAGALLVQESGGLVADLKGGFDFAKTGELIACHAKLFKTVLKAISG